MGKPCVPQPAALLRLAALLSAILPLCAQAPVVTDTERVRVGSNKTELLRKINGRWWTQDNRLVNPPSSRTSGFPFWTITSKPGVVEFYHHRPFDVRRGEQLRLFMTPDQVEAAFGPPNRRFPMGSARGGRWYYHGADGTILDLWFMGEDELGQAKYDFPRGEDLPVAAIERELNGRSIFSLMAERASQRTSQKWSSGRTGGSSRSASTQSIEVLRAAEPSAPPRFSIVTRDALNSIPPGAARADVVQRLGQPTFKSSISDDEGARETYTYHLDESTPVSIRLLNGKVTEVR
jgi:hypothetical protein